MIVLLAPLAVAGEPPAPLPRDRPGDVMPDRGWDVEHLDLDVRVDVEGRTISGTATHRLSRLDPRTTRVRLHQVGLDISEVRVDGTAVDGWHAGLEHLDVPVPDDVAQVEVAVDYRATPQIGLHFRGGPDSPGEVLEAWTQGEGHDNPHWYPGWDYPNDKLTVDTHVTAPAGLTAIAVGTASDRTELDDGWTRWSYTLDRPIPNYLVALVVGDYRVVEDTAERADGSELPLQYVVRSDVEETAARRSLDSVVDQVPFFETLLDEPYPYDIYRQVFVQRFMYGGMENATLTTLNDGRLLTDETTVPYRTESVVAHELAHQWFGDLVTCYGWRELWLNEGFATFYAGRWQEQAHGPEYFAGQVHWWHDAARKTRSAPMAARAHTRRGDRDNAAVYVKGASVLQTLRVYLGTEVFDAGVRRYLDEHADRLVETEDLRRALEDVSGKHLGWLFDQWVTGVGVAELHSSWRWLDGQVEVVVEQQTEGAPFTAPLQMEVGFDDGTTTLRRLWIDEGRAVLQLDADAMPAWVAVDPAGGVLADWKHAQEPEAWAAQATTSPHPYARLTALRELGEGPAVPVVIQTLSAVLSDVDAHEMYRHGAARSLGKTASEEAVPALVAAATDATPVLREEAVDALGALARDDGEVLTALRRAMRRDPAVRVRASALAALAKIEPDQAAGTARSWLDRPDPSPGEHLHETAADVLGEHGADRDLGQLIAAIDPSRSRRGRLLHAAAAATRLADDLDDDHPTRSRLARKLEPLLDSVDVRVRSRAIGLLGQIGDTRSEAALTAFAKQNLVAWGELSDRALDAAQLIRRGRDAPSTEQEEADLARLRQQLEALESRLEDLETWH